MQKDRCRVCGVEMEPDEGDFFDFICDRCKAKPKVKKEVSCASE